MTHVRIYAQTRSLGKEEQQIVLFGLRRRNNEFPELSNLYNRFTIANLNEFC